MISQEVVGISEAKATLPSLVRRLVTGEQERCLVFKQNKPVAVLLSIGRYEQLEKLEADIEHFEDALAIARAQEVNDGTTWTLEEVASKLDLV